MQFSPGEAYLTLSPRSTTNITNITDKNSAVVYYCKNLHIPFEYVKY